MNGWIVQLLWCFAGCLLYKRSSNFLHADIDISRCQANCLVTWPRRRHLETGVGVGSLCMWSEERAAKKQDAEQLFPFTSSCQEVPGTYCVIPTQWRFAVGFNSCSSRMLSVYVRYRRPFSVNISSKNYNFLMFDFEEGEISPLCGWMNFSTTSLFPLGECSPCPPRTVTPDWELL